jgi:hypothetical protein
MKAIRQLIKSVDLMAHHDLVELGGLLGVVGLDAPHIAGDLHGDKHHQSTDNHWQAFLRSKSTISFIDCTKALPAVGGRLDAPAQVLSSPSGKHSRATGLLLLNITWIALIT